MKMDYHTFITFLKDYNCEKEFRENYFGQNCGVTFCEDVWNENDIPLEILFRTFLDWDETPEGERFWRKIDNLFQRKFCLGAID